MVVSVHMDEILPPVVFTAAVSLVASRCIAGATSSAKRIDALFKLTIQISSVQSIKLMFKKLFIFFFFLTYTYRLLHL